MIESEAKTKWCPFESNNIGTTIHYNTIPNASYCLGSQCMAWRWSDHKGNPCQANEHKGYGYCGLAGTP